MSYDSAKAAFADWGVDAEAALARLAPIAISMHCWQGDDVVGFEAQTGTSGGGIQATGNHPGRARTPDRHLQHHLERVADAVGAELVERLGTI
ncbi:MAG: L-rhamnose isomerase, partial [Pseudomonadota bacterium]